MNLRFRTARSLAAAVLATALLAGIAACGDDDEAPMGPAAPDLSGTWSLQSFTQGGVTVPGATGTLVLAQTSASGSTAEGTYDVTITIPGQDPIQDAGTFTIDAATGSWTQESSTLPIQSIGTFTLQGNTLTVEVTQPAQAANTSVWTR